MPRRRCARCGEERPERDFDRWRGKAHGYCRPCRREDNREWYERNRDRHIAGLMANNDRYAERNRAIVDAMKSAPCVDCAGRFPPVAMDFDHLDPEAKVYDISYLVRRGASVDRLLEEIEKCELVCSNCHRIRTHGDGRQRREAPPGGIEPPRAD